MKAELVQQQKAQGIIAKGDKAAIQAQTHEQNLPVEETKQKTIQGWEGTKRTPAGAVGARMD